VGKNLPTSSDERVNVRVEELDGVDEIAIVPTTQAVNS
jgi:pyrimidine operon attenuation protein/uracil phosphoribosyltransferase